MPGRSIRIFLIDGTPSGLRTAEIGLSTIKALVIPRASLSAGSKRKEVQRTGVYILVGKDSDNPGLYKIYVGEGDNILNRLSAHNKDPDKDFWEEAVLFVSKAENLNEAQGRFLEARLITLAKQAKRTTVTNVVGPDVEGWLTEADEVEMEEFIGQARLLIGTLGYNLFEPTVTLAQQAPLLLPAQAGLPEFVYAGGGYSGTCVVDLENGRFVVKANSKARKQEGAALQGSYKNLRAQLQQSGVLAEEGESLSFVQDYAFTSITAAAQVVSGQTVTGRNAWKMKDGGKTFGEWEDEQLPPPADE